MIWLLTLALVLRLVFLNQSLWLDEAIQALALMGKMGPLTTYALADFQPPLYHFIGWLWTSIAGYSELSLRTPSLLAGLGTVYYVAKLGEHLGGQKLKYVSGLLAATNPLLIYYAQEGRTYSLTTFLVTAAFYYYLILLKPSPKRANLHLALYTLFSLLFLWTSYLTWFLHFLLLIYTCTLKRRSLLLAQVGSALTLLFWMPSLTHSLQIGLSTISSAPEWGNVVGGISLKALALTWVKTQIGRISFSPSWVYGLVVAALFILHARVLLTLKKLPPVLLVWLLSIPTLALVSLALPVYSYTRVLFVVPAYLLLLSLALAPLPRSWSYLVLTSQLLCLVYFWVNPSFHREDWRAVVKEYGSSSTYALPSRAQSAPLEYYGVNSSQIIEPKLNLSQPYSSTLIYLNYVEDIFDPSRLGRANLKTAGYTLSQQKVYPGLQVELYENHN